MWKEWPECGRNGQNVEGMTRMRKEWSECGRDDQNAEGMIRMQKEWSECGRDDQNVEGMIRMWKGWSEQTVIYIVNCNNISTNLPYLRMNEEGSQLLLDLPTALAEMKGVNVSTRTRNHCWRKYAKENILNEETIGLTEKSLHKK